MEKKTSPFLQYCGAGYAGIADRPHLSPSELSAISKVAAVHPSWKTIRFQADMLTNAPLAEAMTMIAIASTEPIKVIAVDLRTALIILRPQRTTSK